MFMEIKKQAKCLSIHKIIFAIVNITFSLVAFLFATFPQTNPFNTNPIEKANAGHSESQMFLANHYYEIGDIEESYYWYKIASTTKGKYQATALNNLAYLELTYLKSSDMKIDYLDKAFKVLDNAVDLGEKTALENTYILLLANDEKFFNNIDYWSELSRIEKLMVDNKIDVSKYQKYKNGWEYVETICGAESVPSNTDEYRFIGTGADRVRSDEPYKVKMVYTYDVYKYKLGEEVLLPEYIYIDNF